MRRAHARPRTLRSDLIDSTIAVRHDRVVKRAGDGAIAERDFIIVDIKRSGAIGEVRWRQEGERLNLGKVNRYVADSESAVAQLA